MAKKTKKEKEDFFVLNSNPNFNGQIIKEEILEEFKESIASKEFLNFISNELIGKRVKYSSNFAGHIVDYFGTVESVNDNTVILILENGRKKEIKKRFITVV